LFEAHDRSAFEMTAFSLGPNTGDEMRQRLEGAFDRFLDVCERPDQEIAELARQLELDIAVDLSGYTEHSRPGLFALRVAPLQVSFLGFPGTLRASFIDYVIADRTVIPEWSRGHYLEKIIFMPRSYLVNDSTRPIANHEFSRAALGLPDSDFVYSCFNNSYKLAPRVFDRWMHMLARVEGSVLWLSEGCPTMRDNLRSEAASRGVGRERLVFASRMPSLAERLARHRAADLALDTLPFNGHSTTADALLAGLPVLTCVGGTFAGRVAASLLEAIGLPELVAATHEQYEELAVDLASQPDRLAELRRKLANLRLTTPAFDIRLFTQTLEAAYREIHRRAAAGLPPEDISAQPPSS